MTDLDLIDAYDFDLPEGLIAAQPPEQRGSSRLLVLGTTGAPVDRQFSDLAELLRPGDLLVLNDARVVAARVWARRATGGRVEVFLLGTTDEGRWETEAAGAAQPLVALTRASKALRAGEELHVADGVTIEVVAAQQGDVPARLLLHGCGLSALEQSWGQMPLPPYIERERERLGAARVCPLDRDRYQTVFAKAPGAVAAPTAGLHFTDELLGLLARRGVEVATLTLHVGVGTFRPVKAARLSEHEMHEERYRVPPALAAAWREARARGGRVIAVGTTVVRALESARAGDVLREGAGSTRLLIRPGYPFGAIDGMVTNFHLPRSTLLALVAAFGGHRRVLDAYAHAVASGYRFFSYGDAMWIERDEGTCP